jgi:hypothetical protein
MGGLGDVPENIANYFALGAEMHGLWAMLLGRAVSVRAGEAAFGAVLFSFFPLLLAAVFGWARERGLGLEWAWLAAAMVAGVPTVYEVAGGGYVDLALALYVTLAIRAAARWWDTQDRASLAESALALGFALAVKLTAAFVVFVVVLIVLARMRGAPAGGAGQGRLGAGLAVLAGALAIGCPWYLRTWVRTGSPVFPFFAGVWPGRAPGWDIERSTLLVGFNALYGGADKRPLDYLLAPFSVSLLGQREVAASTRASSASRSWSPPRSWCGPSRAAVSTPGSGSPPPPAACSSSGGSSRPRCSAICCRRFPCSPWPVPALAPP